MKSIIRAIAFVCLLVPLTARAQNTLSITVSSDSATTITATIAASEVRVRQAGGSPIAFIISDSAGSPTTLTIEAGGSYSFFGTSGAGYSLGGTVGTIKLTRGGPVAFQVIQLPKAATATTAANLSGTPALPNGTTATTQSVGDNTQKLATDAFVLANSTQTIASGTASLGTSAISSGTCATVVTVAATGAATTDNIMVDFNADPTGVVGYQASATGMLTIIRYPTSGNVNFKVCNNTGGSITPGAITLNWRVVR